MPAHPTRRGLLALVTLFVFVFMAVQPVLARNTYEIHDGTEGDPGDGVLKPVKPSVGLPRQPVTLLASEHSGWFLPLFVMPANGPMVPVWFIAPSPASSADAGGSPAVIRPRDRRWHHAR